MQVKPLTILLLMSCSGQMRKRCGASCWSTRRCRGRGQRSRPTLPRPSLPWPAEATGARSSGTSSHRSAIVHGCWVGCLDVRSPAAARLSECRPQGAPVPAVAVQTNAACWTCRGYMCLHLNPPPLCVSRTLLLRSSPYQETRPVVAPRPQPGGFNMCCLSLWCPCIQYGMILEQLPPVGHVACRAGPNPHRKPRRLPAQTQRAAHSGPHAPAHQDGEQPCDSHAHRIVPRVPFREPRPHYSRRCSAVLLSLCRAPCCAAAASGAAARSLRVRKRGCAAPPRSAAARSPAPHPAPNPHQTMKPFDPHRTPAGSKPWRARCGSHAAVAPVSSRQRCGCSATCWAGRSRSKPSPRPARPSSTPARAATSGISELGRRGGPGRGSLRSRQGCTLAVAYGLVLVRWCAERAVAATRRLLLNLSIVVRVACRYGIASHPLHDCFLVWCCAPCALMQGAPGHRAASQRRSSRDACCTPCTAEARHCIGGVRVRLTTHCVRVHSRFHRGARGHHPASRRARA
jgi:hypothetical protein